MLIKTIPVGQLEENCYVVTNERTLECVVIDPGDESNTILDYLELNRLTCRAIFITHAEGGVSYDDGDVIEAAGLRFEIIATPGHSPGSVTIRCENALFTGDTLFRGSCGRVDLDGSVPADELRSLKRLCSLEGDFEVYPGHMDSTTLERERMFNYYCREAMKL